MEETFKEENLQRTYGGRLTVLSHAADALFASRAIDKDARDERS
jgi:hypothetical protein